MNSSRYALSIMIGLFGLMFSLASLMTVGPVEVQADHVRECLYRRLNSEPVQRDVVQISSSQSCTDRSGWVLELSSIPPHDELSCTGGRIKDADGNCVDGPATPGGGTGGTPGSGGVPSGIDPDASGSGSGGSIGTGRSFDDEKPPTDEFETTGICEGDDDSNCDCDTEGDLNPENCEIIRYIEIGINVLSGIAGVAIVGGIMVGGYMYMTARDNPGQTAAARQRVAWALIALLILIFFWGVLQWLVPGGILGSPGGGGPPPIPSGGGPG